MSSFITAHEHIIGYFGALQWCEYCDKQSKTKSETLGSHGFDAVINNGVSQRNSLTVVHKVR